MRSISVWQRILRSRRFVVVIASAIAIALSGSHAAWPQLSPASDTDVALTAIGVQADHASTNVASGLQALEAAQVSTVANTAPQANAVPVVTVQHGQVLSKIAADHGSGTQCLAEKNGIADPDVVQAGKQIRIVAECKGVRTVAKATPIKKRKLAAKSHADNSAPKTSSGTKWDKLAQCESGGNWSINTHNGFSGGLQFTPSTWKAFGGSGSAHNASREQQIAVAERVLAKQGWNAWPACSRKLGLR